MKKKKKKAKHSIFHLNRSSGFLFHKSRATEWPCEDEKCNVGVKAPACVRETFAFEWFRFESAEQMGMEILRVNCTTALLSVIYVTQ